MPETSLMLSISAITQAFATIVLVGVTIYYAVQTKKTVDTMDSSTKSEFLPILMIGFYSNLSDDKTLYVSLENIGKGLAKRPIELRFPGVGPIRLNSMTVGGAEKAKIEYNLDHVLDIPESQRKICITYHDIFSREIKTEANFVLRENFGPDGNKKGIGWDVWTPIIP